MTCFGVRPALITCLVGVTGVLGGYLIGRQQQPVVAPDLSLPATSVSAKVAAPAKTTPATAGTKAATPETTKRPEPYIASEQETADAITQLQAAGGLILPKQMFVMAGQIVDISWWTIVPVVDPEVFAYDIHCTCSFATLTRRSIVLNPRANAKGTYTLRIKVNTAKNQPVSEASLAVIVVPMDAGAGKQFSMLLVGDSLGHQNRFPNELAKLFRRRDNPTVQFVGTHRPAGAMIPHEHYGGWTFERFYTLLNQDPVTYYRSRSPFVFEGPDGKAVFDVTHYLDKDLGGMRPRNVHIQLGTNDAFALGPEDPDFQGKLAAIIAKADTLIAGIRRALPDSIITVGSVIQANTTDRAFIESYRAYPQFHRASRWRQVQMALARHMVDHFQNRRDQHIHLVPTHMTVDPLDGYRAHIWVPDGVEYDLTNAVHPSPVGERQLANTIYAVVKAELAGLASN